MEVWVTNGVQGCLQGTNVPSWSIPPAFCFSSLVELNLLPCCLSKHTLCCEGAANYIPRVCAQLKKTNLLPHSSAHNLHGSIEHHLHTNRPAHKPSKTGKCHKSWSVLLHPNQASTMSHFLTLSLHQTSQPIPFFDPHEGHSGVTTAQEEESTTNFQSL